MMPGMPPGYKATVDTLVFKRKLQEESIEFLHTPLKVEELRERKEEHCNRSKIDSSLLENSREDCPMTIRWQ